MQEKIEFEGWPNCIRLYNNDIELIITTDIGPRIIRFGYINGENLFYVSPADKGKSGGENWRIYGGHRFWHAPEVAPRTYSPDNKQVSYSWNGKTLKLIQDVEPLTGIIKEMEITLNPNRNEVKVLHRIINKNCWHIELAPWAITACAGGGRVILPQEPYIDPADYLLPARPIVLWNYTQMADPRFAWGDKFIQVKHDPARISEQKIGILNKQGWAAYVLHNELFIKKFEYNPYSQYTDYGCNNEAYVNGDFLELETLSLFSKIAPLESIVHTEYWTLTKAAFSVGEDKNLIEQLIAPVLDSILQNR